MNYLSSTVERMLGLANAWYLQRLVNGNWQDIASFTDEASAYAAYLKACGTPLHWSPVEGKMPSGGRVDMNLRIAEG